MAFQNTVWPSGDTPKDFQDWVTGFFETLEDATDEAAKRLSEYFTEDGDITLANLKIHGAEGHCPNLNPSLNPKNSAVLTHGADVHVKRLKAWDTILVRKFAIHRVYTSDSGCDDIMILGHLGTVFTDKRKGTEEWSARIRSHIDEQGLRKISLYRIWTVCVVSQMLHMILFLTGSRNWSSRARRSKC